MKKCITILLGVPAVCTAGASAQWPAYPLPIKNGAGARIGDIVYAGLGSAGQNWHALDLATPGARWTALAAFPDSPRDAANAVAVDGKIYLFGGAGKLAASDAVPQIFDAAYEYDPAANRWQRLRTRLPLGSLGASVVSTDQRNIVFFGGVNKAIYDGYFLDLTGALDDLERQAVNERYFDQRPQDYLWTAQILSYHPATNRWRNLGVDPAPPTIGAGVAIRGDRVTLVNGEIKPGLRTASVKQLTLAGDRLVWRRGTELPAPPGTPRQEGLAGSFAGYSNDVLLVAGGANFPGARQQFDGGKNYAHRGLTKTWRDEIYAYKNGRWLYAGKLPLARGYGISIQLDNGVLMVGGELQDGTPSTDVLVLDWDGKTARVRR